MPEASVYGVGGAPAAQAGADPFILRLSDCMKRADGVLRPFRKKRKDFIQSYCGAKYGDTGGRVRPLNMAHGALSTLVPMFVMHNPRAMVTSNYAGLRGLAIAISAILDVQLPDMGFDATLRNVLADAMYLFGVGKTAIGYSGVDLDYDPGEPFFARVSPANFVFDTDAQEWDACYYMGDRYRIPDELFRAGGYEHADTVRPNNFQRHDDEENSQTVGRAQGRKRERGLVDEVELWDIFLPAWNPYGGNVPVVITVAASERAGDLSGRALRVAEWRGPQGGPYDLLHFFSVPDNVIPLAPAAVWSPLDDLINSLARKLKNQAERQKILGLYAMGQEKDADTIRKALDGDMVGVSDPGRVKELMLGGFSPQIHQMVTWLMDAFSRTAGNVDMLGGLRADAKTATEASYLQSNAANRIADGRRNVWAFAGRVMRKLAWFYATDPGLAVPLELRPPGHKEPIPVPITRDLLEGMLRKAARDLQADYDEMLREAFRGLLIAVEPYSMEDESPEKRVEKMMFLVGKVIMPLMPIAAAQGQQVPVKKLVEAIAREMHVRNTDELFETALPTEMPGMGSVDYSDQAQPVARRPGIEPRGERAATADIAELPQTPEQAAAGVQSMKGQQNA